ncbi:TetR/AcrR family transcriptional regulator [Rhodococcus sp. D2-41]|uniref:TetR/AcrR family transcriptional regulator n=1 Tax=Speluncibacter jeojiensis TaxID=2710754 RepID=A0A9X4RCE4_9ACTN|nr:TetR/AcrR family transcriptional regulator [Rhodococcus sp. D2-41]MDG3012023.1 TetR/AcrR family transcriptional regulator [Rhodococcus sp. D2-41]MDG3013478.1 TetR/AcrR family transcriptional regulator [Corynebacteriales bacterium D3-21]
MAAQSTRDRILDALEGLLLESSPAQVTLEAVAAAAGVSKGGLLYHFPSKEALLAGMVRRLGERADKQLADAVAGGRSISEFYLESFGPEDIAEMPLYRSALAALRSVDGRHDEVQQAVTEVMRSWDSGLQAEIDDPVQAEIVRLVGDGIFLAGLLGLPQPDPDLHRQVVARLLGR